MAEKKHLKGVIFFAVVTILDTFICIFFLGGWDWERYKFIFQYLPSYLIPIRCFFSILFRSLLIISAIGVLQYKDIFRKLLIVLCILNIIGAYWKHPYQTLIYIDQYNHVVPDVFEQAMRSKFGVAFPSYETVKRLSAFAAYFMELLSSGVSIYYFTHPNVKKRFV